MKNSKLKTYGIGKCRQCNKGFTPSNSLRKFCSQECAKIYRKEYKKNYSQSEGQKKYRQSDERKNYVREYLKSDERKEYRREYQKKWLQTDKGKNANKKSQKKYQQSDKYKKYLKEHQQSDEYKKYQKKYQQSDKYKKYLKKYRQSERHKEVSKKYQQSDKGKTIHNKSKKKYQNERRKSDPLYKLTVNVRSRLYSFLRVRNMKKTNRTFEMVGCTPKFLKEYLEQQFHPHPITNKQMTWKNHIPKGWHVDHRIPLDKAKNPKDVKKLMHYTNLQPLWATENIKKGNRII